MLDNSENSWVKLEMWKDKENNKGIVNIVKNKVQQIKKQGGGKGGNAYRDPEVVWGPD